MKGEVLTCDLLLVPQGRSKVFQIPPDVVVKLNLLILLRLFDHRSEEKTSSKRYVKTGNDGLSGSPHLRLIGLPRKPIACGLSVSAHQKRREAPAFMPGRTSPC